MDKHTPGPLEAVGNLVRSSMVSGGFLVAECRDANGKPYSDEAKANAALFAAAPELLEALDSLLTDVGRASSLRGAVKARAALAKARGEA